MMNTCIMMRTCEETTEKMYDFSMLFKIRGFQLKGGKLNLLNGLLQVEESREFTQHLGCLQIEFSQFERDCNRFVVSLNVTPRKENPLFPSSTTPNSTPKRTMNTYSRRK